MARWGLASLMIMILGSVAAAQEPTRKPSDTPTQTGTPNPDDTKALNAFTAEQIREISRWIRIDVKTAEQRISAFRTQLEGLAPQTAEGKTRVERARTSLRFYEDQIALTRMPLADLEARLKADANDVDAMTKYTRKVMSEIGSKVSSDPVGAETLLGAARTFLGTLKETTQTEAVKKQIDQVLTSLASYERSLAAERTRARLIGQKAAPLDVETWVNGSPVTDQDLKGKVVLMDFWAVWCGPCIATFPHLREWQEKYADKGLVMIGMTRYYNYKWDEANQKALRAPDPEKITPEQEQAMLVKFARQHQLSHRFGVQKANTLSEFYGVTGIPQVVVIDREGTVRMIKVGSGEANAKAIGDLLETLLGTPQGAGN